uniref:Uncharacterized protein n=1 Tax=Arundo donax TaxID=35708 RepID=A0A0A9ANM6_ARUDO
MRQSHTRICALSFSSLAERWLQSKFPSLK